MTRFTFDPDRSTITIAASSSVHPIRTEAAVRGWIEGTVTGDRFDPGAPVAGMVEFDLAVMRSGNPLIDREAERRLHIRRHPVVSGSLTSVTDGGSAQLYEATGDLTFHGVTRAISGQLRIELRDGVVGVTGTTAIDVTDFGVQPPSMILLKVHKDVEVELTAFAT